MAILDLFRPRRVSPVDYSPLVADCHAHLLPGIDDGPADVGTAVTLVEALLELGFRRLAATPHVMADLYPNTPASIADAHQLLARNLTAAGIRVPLHVAAEYLLDEHFGTQLAQGSLLSLPGRRVLVEQSMFGPSPQLDHYIFQLQMAGYQPIIAHPERYTYWHGNWRQYEQLRERGCWLQVNLLSLVGYYDPSVQRAAEKLIKLGLVDLVGTDAHHLPHVAALREGLSSRAITHLLKAVPLKNPTFSS